MVRLVVTLTIIVMKRTITSHHALDGEGALVESVRFESKNDQDIDQLLTKKLIPHLAEIST